MTDIIVVKRYAEAFMDFASETIGIKRAIQDFKALKSLMRANPEIEKILQSLDVSYSEKCDFIDKILSQDYSQEFRQFLKFLLEKKRIDKIIDIADYIRVAHKYQGEADAVLKTSFPLDLELIKEIKDKLENKFSRKFRFYIDLDADLLGGVQLIVGNRIFDGSLRRCLEDLKEKLLTIRV